MDNKGQCGKREMAGGPAEYETVSIEKTRNVCPMCEDYAKAHGSKPVVVMCCEGAYLPHRNRLGRT